MYPLKLYGYGANFLFADYAALCADRIGGVFKRNFRVYQSRILPLVCTITNKPPFLPAQNGFEKRLGVLAALKNG
jgi:hypothetical protein